MTTRKHPAIIALTGLWMTHRNVFIWYWSILILIVAAASLSIPGFMLREINLDGGSIWSQAAYSPKIFLLVIGILLTPLSMPNYVSNGLTRKHFVAGSIIFICLVSLLFSIVSLIGYIGEPLLADLFNKETIISPPLLEAWIQHFTLYCGCFATGWLVGSGFYALNWKAGIVISVLALIPLILMDLGGRGTTELFEHVIDLPSISFWIQSSINALIAAMLMALNYLLLRQVAIRRKIIQ